MSESSLAKSAPTLCCSGSEGDTMTVSDIACRDIEITLIPCIRGSNWSWNATQLK